MNQIVGPDVLAFGVFKGAFKLMYNIYHQNAPSYLVDIIPSREAADNRYNLRNQNDIPQFNTRIEKFRKSVFPDCIRKWNTLPLNTRNSDNVKEFVNKTSVKYKNKLLYQGFDRKAGIVHAQMRMRCSNLNEHLYALHVLESPNCICANEVEDCEHFFFKCLLYNNHRAEFFNNIADCIQNYPDVCISTKLLLFGSEKLSPATNVLVFKLVEKFISDSSRF